MLSKQALYRVFSSSVFIWRSTTSITTKKQNIKSNFDIPTGVPIKIENFDFKNISQINFGLNHSFALSEQGEVYGFGKGASGAMGLENRNNVHYRHPKRIPYFHKHGIKIKEAVIGEMHSLFLGEEGGVYSAGYGGKKGWLTKDIGALGHETFGDHIIPTEVDFFKHLENIKPIQIASGKTHSAVLMDNGDIYSWGKGGYGTLGTGNQKDANSPQMISALPIYREIDPNNHLIRIDAADEYSAALTKGGSLCVWGKNDQGQMGIGTGIGADFVESENIPVVVDFPEEGTLIKDFACGQNTMIALTSKGEVYKLGFKLYYHPTLLEIPPEIGFGTPQKVYSGKKHYLILDDKNQLLIWGNVMKSKIDPKTNLALINGDEMFGGKILDLSVKYSSFGALVDLL